MHFDFIAAGWGSSLKLLETQKQLQEKKLMLQNISKVLENGELSLILIFEFL